MERKLFFSVLLSFLIANSASATPSNIIRVPSTDVQHFGTFHLGMDVRTTMFRPVRSGGHADPVIFGLTLGLLDAGVLKFEGGVDVREVTDKPITFNGKVVLPEGTLHKEMPAIGFGLYDVGTDKDKNDYNIFYGEMAKTVSFIGRFTVGYFVGNSHMLKDSSGRKDNSGMLFAFDRRMPEINERLWFGIDFQGTQSFYGATSFGVSWSFAENASLVLGYVIYNDQNAPGAGNNVTTWQVDFDF